MSTIENLPFCVTQDGPEDISGDGNYILEIKSSKSENTKSLLYFFDTHSSFHRDTNLGSYEWLGFNQISWYREKSTGS